jgi:hypothetical protein
VVVVLALERRERGSRLGLDRQQPERPDPELLPDGDLRLAIATSHTLVAGLDPDDARLPRIIDDALDAPRDPIESRLEFASSASVIAGLRQTIPISVLSRSDLGSRLSEPMNTARRSKKNVLACSAG